MTGRIFLKLISVVLLAMALALTAIGILSGRLVERAYLDHLDTELKQKVQMLQVMERDKLLTLTPASVAELARNSGARVTVIAHDGRVLFDSSADPSTLENHAGRPEIREAMNGRIGSSLRHSVSIGIRFLYTAGPIQDGVIRLAVPVREIEAQVALLQRQLVGIAALAFLPGILLAAAFARGFSTRLGTAIHYASTLATGNFKARLQQTGNDELGVLASQLNETGEKLQKMFEELEREQVELEKLERVRKDFIINVSHELRTPLASIQGYTETLLEGAIHDNENNVRFLNIIRQNTERLARLTGDLLTLSRLELKTQEFNFDSFYVNTLLQDCIDTLRPMAEKKQLRLRFKPAPDGSEVYCDSEALHQVIVNLVDNAIKYTPEGGTITVMARAIHDAGAAKMVEIGIRDTGIGIPEDDLPRLFERFYRVDKARSRALGGTGLGLAIVKHLVRSMGGEVQLESAVNQGSTFRFTLPSAPPDGGLQPDGKVVTVQKIDID